MSSGKSTARKSGKGDAKASREARLAAALRANLKRRKAAKAGETVSSVEPRAGDNGRNGPQSGTA